ncbi:MAG: rhamnulokinase [Candidatus Promineofilum sp.]|nr:rhamnulokinase [Promineifilum sp.]
MKMLAFDLGASSGKIFQGNYDGRALALKQISRFKNQSIAIRDELFWNILEIYRNLEEGISKALQGGEVISSIGLDSYSNDFGLLDRDGRLVTQVHCYRDSRTLRNEERIYSLISREKLHRLSGNQNALFGTLMQLASMSLENQGYLLEGAGTLLFTPDLLSYFLTGEIHSEYTISSVSQMLDFATGTWSSEILNVFSIPARIFPEVIQPGTRVGILRGVRNDLPKLRSPEVVAVCEHDTASAFLAAPFGDSSIIVSSGTWSLVGVETPIPIINGYTYEHNIANEGSLPGHHRLLKNVMGQWIVQECQRVYAERGVSYSIVQLIELATKEPPFQFMINPNDERFFSPGNMPEKVMDYCNEYSSICPESPGQIIRCVMESLALHYRLVIGELEEATGRKFRAINIIGGGSNNHFLNQCVANATGRQVFAGPEEASSLGNILVQLLSAKEIDSIDQGRELIRRSYSICTYEPEDVTEWDARYEQYLGMISNVRSTSNA